MSIIATLENRLIGNFYSRISVGDTYDLFFDRFWLISQNVVSPDEEALNVLISDYGATTKAIDMEDIAKTAILSSTLRKVVTKVHLNSDSSLELVFDNNVKLVFPTDNDIVDWQWAVNENGQDPYNGLIVGVLETGTIQLG